MVTLTLLIYINENKKSGHQRGFSIRNSAEDHPLVSQAQPLYPHEVSRFQNPLNKQNPEHIRVSEEMPYSN